MRVICIHVYGHDIDKRPLQIEVGGIYVVIEEYKVNGLVFYELKHDPGYAYRANCFVPLDDQEIQQSEIEFPELEAVDVWY